MATRTAKGTKVYIASTTTVTLAAVTLAAGDALVVGVIFDSLGGATSAAVSWGASALTEIASAGGINAGTVLFLLANAAADTRDIVVTFDNLSSSGSFWATAWSGLTASPLDKTAAFSGTGASPSSGNTATTTQADEVLIGCIGTEGAVGDAAGSWSGSFTAGQRDGPAVLPNTIAEGYRVVSATGAYAAAKTGIDSRDWGAVIATLKVGGTTHAGAAVLAGAATVAAVAVGVFVGAAALAGAGTVAAAGQGVFSGVSALSGVGTAAGAGVGVFKGAAALSGVATVAATPNAVYGAALLASGGATLTAGISIHREYPAASGVVVVAPISGTGLSGAASIGIRSKGKPYFAFWTHGPKADIGGGEQRLVLGFSISKAPTMYSSPSEPHWLASFHEVGGIELMSLGITPDLRVCATTRLSGILLTGPGVVPLDGEFHQYMFDLLAPDGLGNFGRVISRDGASLLFDDSGLGAGEGAFTLSGLPVRFMLFNGVAGTTRCECSILYAGLANPNGLVEWPINEGRGDTLWGGDVISLPGDPVIVNPDQNYPDNDFILTPDWYNPLPYPLIWGGVPSGSTHGAWDWLLQTQFRQRTIIRPDYRPRSLGPTDYREAT